MVCCNLNMVKIVLMMNSRESDIILIIKCYFNRVNKLCSYVRFFFFFFFCGKIDFTTSCIFLKWLKLDMELGCWNKLTLNRVRGRSYWLFYMIDIKIQRNHHQKIKNKKYNVSCLVLIDALVRLVKIQQKHKKFNWNLHHKKVLSKLVLLELDKEYEKVFPSVTSSKF